MGRPEQLDREGLMREALEQAALARDDGDWAIGCVIALRGDVIARGRNRVNSSRNRMAHAEVDALSRIQDKYFEHTYNGEMVIATTFEPCIMCFGAVVLNGIRHIVSGVNLDDSGASAMADGLPPYFQQERYRTTLETGVLEKECAEMWASGKAAQAMLANGYVLPRTVESLSNDRQPTVYTTAIIPPKII
jgi:tRNA(adenine34) deaminase